MKSEDEGASFPDEEYIQSSLLDILRNMRSILLNRSSIKISQSVRRPVVRSDLRGSVQSLHERK
jgi:hypothetical protein